MTVRRFHIQVCPDCAISVKVDSSIQKVDRGLRRLNCEFDVRVTGVYVVNPCSQFLFPMSPKDKQVVNKSANECRFESVRVDMFGLKKLP